MTVAALLLTCLAFVSLGRTDKTATLTALSVAAVVCIASSNGGTTSQDLKTGFLVGSTPRKQQIAILIGALVSAVFIGYTLLLLNNAGTVYSKNYVKENVSPNFRIPADLLAALQRQRPGGQYSDDTHEYYVFHVGEAEATPELKAGKYLADDDGKLVYFVDPAINGTLDRTDDGHSVRDVKYQAPKTQLMEKIISGIFNQKLPWGLVLLGVLISVTLELSGVPSLPFAVGVYLPLESSAPIFLGGAVRYVSDYMQKRRGRAMSESESEMSSGSLLSTGYIAGASIAGVIYAFVAASPALSDSLAQWQYRTTTVAKEAPVADAIDEAARRELGLPLGVPKDDLSEHDKAALEDEIAEFDDINASVLPKYVPLLADQKLKISQGTKLALEGGRRLAQDEEIPVPGDTHTLGDFASKVLGSSDKAVTVFDNNKEQLKLPKTLPAGAVLRVPQRDLTAAIAAGAMVLFLLLVGLGVFLKTPPSTAPTPDAT
jgi:hypothetical protein